MTARLVSERLTITAELIAERDAAAERQEQAAIEAALFTARDEQERQLVLRVLRERAIARNARTRLTVVHVLSPVRQA